MVHLGKSCGEAETHPKSLNVDELTRAGLLAFADLSSVEDPVPSRNYFSIVNDALRAGEDVLIPCHVFSSLGMDLIESTLSHLEKIKGVKGTVIVTSPEFDNACETFKNFVDWLSDAAHARVIAGEEAFRVMSFVEGNTGETVTSTLSNSIRVVITSTLSGNNHDDGDATRGLEVPLEPPFVIFAGHPRLNKGEAMRLLRFWQCQRSPRDTKQPVERQTKSHVIRVDPAVSEMEFLTQVKALRQNTDSGEVTEVDDRVVIHHCLQRSQISRPELDALRNRVTCIDLQDSGEHGSSMLKQLRILHVGSWPARFINYVVKHYDEVRTARVLSPKSLLLFVRCKGAGALPKECKVTVDLGASSTIRLLCDEDAVRTKILHLIEGK